MINNTANWGRANERANSLCTGKEITGTTSSPGTRCLKALQLLTQLVANMQTHE